MVWESKDLSREEGLVVVGCQATKSGRCNRFVERIGAEQVGGTVQQKLKVPPREGVGDNGSVSN